jgi:hypothetical protein
MNSLNDERRRAPRADISDTLFIESISSSRVTSIGSDLKTCNTVNVSACGMQVILDFEVLVDSEVALWIIREDAERILVSGIVRWTNRMQGEDQFLVGIEIQNEDADAMESWVHGRRQED